MRKTQVMMIAASRQMTISPIKNHKQKKSSPPKKQTNKQTIFFYLYSM